jgi:hypothetical protein
MHREYHRWHSPSLGRDMELLWYGNSTTRVDLPQDWEVELHPMQGAKAPALTFTAPHVLDWRPPTDARCIRVGICSSFLRNNHTIGKLYEGLIGRLDRSRFRVTVIHSHDAEGPQDAVLPRPPRTDAARPAAYRPVRTRAAQPVAGAAFAAHDGT